MVRLLKENTLIWYADFNIWLRRKSQTGVSLWCCHKIVTTLYLMLFISTFVPEEGQRHIIFIKKKESFVYLSDTCTFSSQPFWTYESLYTFRFRENFSLNSHLTSADSGSRTHHLPITPWLCLMHTRQWKDRYLNHWTTEHCIINSHIYCQQVCQRHQGM